ncbi:uncharacterized protein AFUA_2G17370 [Aspergillus fumigatus Af293]|uniref:PH domain-containing protein n=2 Tax=Aspergillus fumigatus TaxID=746128 RepID=Q4WZD1_ASPFU|nr:hypothetical protein AFUA_2G17370 [Aspergillus fumigatus Af293]EAL94034.1 hypothetical protein AFUA_2G17370 [Aspergillus fumigatus Af293]EDP55240.1 hypothetical protein AFUB_033040 [Aspergillus fumigatus A1163]KEY76572.1 hypothetical protein BA78_7462 [Aspergillus fumigatus]
MVFYAYATSGGFSVWLITAKDKDTLDAWFRAMETSQFGNIARINAEWYRYQNFRIEHSTTDYCLTQRFDGLILFKPLYYIRSKKSKSLYWDVKRKSEAESLQVYVSTKSRARFQAIKILCPNYAPSPVDHRILGDDRMSLHHAAGPVSFIRNDMGFLILTISCLNPHFRISELTTSFASQPDNRIAYIPGFGAEWELVY